MGRYRLALDTGGTFTDVVALDEQSGRTWTTKTPSTPADPAVGFIQGVAKVARQVGFSLSEVTSLSHGTTVATNALLAEEFPGLGLIVTRGFKDILEIARQSVPQGYGNSYFWVKPERIVPVHHVREVTERLDFRGEVLTRLDEMEAERVAMWFRERGLDCIGVCFLHAYANPTHEAHMRDILARVHPAAHVSISSEVLPEYREYERAVTTLVDAFVKPRVSRYVSNIQQRLEHEVQPGTPLYIMQSNGGAVSAAEVARQPVATILSGPAAGALGATLLARAAGFERALTLDGGGTSTDAAVVEGGVPHLTTSGAVGRFPVKVPMIDVVTVGAGGGSIAWLAADGRLRVGPRSAGAEPGPMCYARGGQQPTVTDAALLLGRLAPYLLGGEIPLDRSLAEQGLSDLANRLGLDVQRTAAGILEIAAWNQANAVRQVTVRRGLDVRDYLLVAFGGSGPLQAGALVDVLGLRGALIPLNPGNVSAFGLLTVDLKNDYVATSVQRSDRLDLGMVHEVYARLEDQAQASLGRNVQMIRSADLRYFGQAWEVRVEVPGGRLDRAAADTVVDRFHRAHQKTYGYSYAASAEQVVEWVNLRVTGVRPLDRPALPRLERNLPGGSERARAGSRAVWFANGFTETPLYARQHFQPGDCIEGPAIVEEFGSTSVVPPGLVASVDDYGNLLLVRSSSVAAEFAGGARTRSALASGAESVRCSTGFSPLPSQGEDRQPAPATPASGEVDPVLVEIVEGTLASTEAEVEAAIERTSRSPMIREARDFRGGIHDRRCRKLTGRSYSALVQPIVRDFPLQMMRPGDVFFHNDVYQSEGGIGHLPDLCVTVPVHDDQGEVVAFVQAFGHHDDIGGCVPGSMPSHGTSYYQEGLIVPPVRLYAAGQPNDDLIRVLVRNSRLPDSLRGDLDAEVAACRMGAERIADLFRRYGRQQVEACFEVILTRTTETYQRELLSKIPPGTYVWEDYAEHDGVDPPRLHTQRMTLTRTPDRRLLIDLSGTSPQAKGPINHAGNYADGVFLKKWIAPILRNLADTPERMAELEVNEGVVPLIELRFPPPGTLVTPVFPAPVNARTFVILRLLGILAGVLAKATDGNMPADQETIRYTGFYGVDADGMPFLMREVLGGGSGGRPWADGSDTIHVVPDSKNLPVEFTETRFPLRVERLGLAPDSGGPGLRRGGLGYRKEIRVLRDCAFLSVADRSILSCWGLSGGRAGRPFRVTVDPGGPNERQLPGLVDDEPIAAGTLVRIDTTGGGGWGDPLLRSPDLVALDVVQGKVSVAAAGDDYGVVLAPDGESDPKATASLRDRLRASRPGRLPFFDRGPGYKKLSGRAQADVDTW
jgi:N-methylhydantoinase B